MNAGAASARLLRVAAMIGAMAIAIPMIGQSPATVELDAIRAIREEAFERSQAMEVAGYLADVFGPRLTGSPNLKAAADYTVEKLREWGISNAWIEPWGPFGRGWTNDRFSVHVVSAPGVPVIAYPLAWTPGTNGPVVAEAVTAIILSEADFARYRGQLRGKFVLVSPMPDVAAHFEPLARRWTDADLEELASPAAIAAPNPAAAAAAAFNRRWLQFFVDEGAAALIEPGVGDGGTVRVFAGGSFSPNAAPVPPQVVMAVEHYGRIFRMLERNIPVVLEMDIRNTFHDETLDSFNVIAELPGTDKAEELVMLGAHLDSWHAGTGATDNASGVAVVMEAMRILHHLGLPLGRTVRLALWTGEEQGLLGSRAYVREHFLNPLTGETKPEHARFSVYFNMDQGTGAIRGLYLQGNTAAAPIFQQWMQPFADYGMMIAAARAGGSTDQIPFIEAGLPGFQFIQDPIEYRTRTQHSSMDVYERIQPGDVMRNAAILAALVYQAANSEELLPRR